MAEVIGAVSGLLTLVIFAAKSSQKLYQVIDGVRSSPKILRELKEELESLDNTLTNLRLTVEASDIDLTALELPLTRCGKACEEFELVITKCTMHSAGKGASFRDWAKLQYMGGDINSFKNLLASYKSTIIISLADANIRNTNITVQLLKEYKAVINNTTSDLQYRLDELKDHLNPAATHNSDETAIQNGDYRETVEEKESVEQCLSILAAVSVHIDEVQTNHFADISTPPDTAHTLTRSEPSSARAAANQSLDSCKEKLSNTRNELKKQLSMAEERINRISDSIDSGASTTESVRKELSSVKQCLNICAQASEEVASERINVFEDVSSLDDAHQVIVATLGDLISGKRITSGTRSVQWLGQMSDDSLQVLAQYHVQPAPRERVYKEPKGENPSDPQFEGRHGSGRKLS